MVLNQASMENNSLNDLLYSSHLMQQFRLNTEPFPLKNPMAQKTQRARAWLSLCRVKV